MSGDWNEDVWKINFTHQFTERGLVAAITGQNGVKGPGTFQNGVRPIDQIFVSTNLKVTSSGYLAHGETLGNHRPD